jgi:hypothetical protein
VTPLACLPCLPGHRDFVEQLLSLFGEVAEDVDESP